VLIPGEDAQGNVWHMDFFHALYFVSFMATTIGFGEIPYEFTDGQRLWVLFSIYATVIVWIYAIGTVLALLRDATFQQAITESRFARRIRHLSEPFFLVCGYGETGSALVRALAERNQHAVAIDIKPDRVNLLALENLRLYVPALCGDARRPVHLLEAGLMHAHCAGVVALTNVNETNLKIAITAKLLHPEVRVICRADSHDVEANMASFGTDHIYDPFDTFGHHLATALQSPCLYLLHEWLTGDDAQGLADPVYPPRQGLWILCGYGRFGKAVYERLQDEGVDIVVVEAQPQLTGMPADGRLVVGRGTEAVTLEEAQIERAVALVAGTDDDVNNLSIVMTALDLNPRLFVVARQNQLDNQGLFDAARAQMVMHPSSIVANKIRVLLATPMLSRFESLALHYEDSWACELISRIIGLASEEPRGELAIESEHERARALRQALDHGPIARPHVWEVSIGPTQAHALDRALERGAVVEVQHLARDPRERDRRLPCIALMLARGNRLELLPADQMRLHAGDRLLYCGRHSAQTQMAWTLQNLHSLDYVLTGGSSPQGALWRLFRRRANASR
jgi:Trk K+ transport system NAD-binding subunit